MIDRDEILNEANSWIETPFHHASAIKGIGCDCLGLIKGVFDVDMKGAYSSYPKSPTQEYVLKLMTRFFIPKTEREPGDIVLLEVLPKQAVHLAILDHNNYIIHSNEIVGKVVKHRLLPSRWPIHSVWTYK